MTGIDSAILALTWRDRVSFTLTEGLQLKKIAFLDGVFEGRPQQPGDEGFDADAAIATGELAPMIDELIDALGGEQVIGAAAAPVPGTPVIATPAAAPVAADLPPWETQSA